MPVPLDARATTELRSGSLGASTPLPADTVLFTIAPEAQIAAYERELRADRGGNLTLVRLYPRDFWYTGEIAR